MKIKRTRPDFNSAQYGPDAADPPALYGLPTQVCFCKSCVISNQRPNSAVEFRHTKDSKKKTINLDEDGICDACSVAQVKRTGIDWNSRERELQELCARYRRDDGRYDCLVPGSGGKDSFFAAHVLKYKYGMNPLTVTWAPHSYTDWGWKNFQAWIHAGFDNVLMTPNGRVHRLLTRLAMEQLLHPFQPFILGQKNIAPKTAVNYDIPLVFYGENEAEYGNPVASNAMSTRDFAYFGAQDRSQVFISGVSVNDLTSEFGLSSNDLDAYMPVDPQRMREKKVEVHYLGYYLKWHPQSCYYYSVEHGGFQASPERTPGTYSKYNSIDDRIDDLHYYTTFIKFGIGRATYDAAQEIRSGEITRDEGVALVKRFDGEFPERFMDENLAYLSMNEREFPIASAQFEQAQMDRDYFQDLCDRHRSPHLWSLENGKWRLRHASWHQDI